MDLKAVEALAPIHDAIVLTYLRLSGCTVGLLINFHTAVLKDGIRRLVLNYPDNEKQTADPQSTPRNGTVRDR